MVKHGFWEKKHAIDLIFLQLLLFLYPLGNIINCVFSICRVGEGLTSMYSMCDCSLSGGECWRRFLSLLGFLNNQPNPEKHCGIFKVKHATVSLRNCSYRDNFERDLETEEWLRAAINYAKCTKDRLGLAHQGTGEIPDGPTSPFFIFNGIPTIYGQQQMLCPSTPLFRTAEHQLHSNIIQTNTAIIRI